MSKERVVVGMSGGVDSSVAALLLKQAGYDVIGITLKIWLGDCSDTGDHSCCGPRAVEDARSVSYQLGIPFYVIDHRDLFQKNVVEYFIDEYGSGRTPNPCVVCNKTLKFGTMFDFAKKLGADKLATGHYAKVGNENGEFILKRGRDLKKDQSYFLYTLDQNRLKNLLFPLGDLVKDEVRDIAQKEGLKVFDKIDSTGICFVPDGKYVNFLKQNAPQDFKKGVLKDTQGNILGAHDGVQNFTIGQRKGLGFAMGRPQYVVSVDGETNTVIVGEESDLFLQECFVHSLQWISPKRPQSMECMVKVRYSHKGAAAKITLLDHDRARIQFVLPERAVTAGQAAVFYDGEKVLGGGFIDLKGEGAGSGVNQDLGCMGGK